MVDTVNQAAYERKFDELLDKMSVEDAVKYHVGGIDNFYVIGAIEAKLLASEGLSDGQYLIDLGCGSGRLIGAIDKTIRFLGIDVVEKLIAYSREQFPQHRFETVTDFVIPERDAQADFVTAFSLFTHLLHEQSFLYIQEAYRVLRPGGKLVLSFLEYGNAGHRKIFLSAVKSAKTDRPLIVFNGRDSFEFFGKQCGFSAVRFIDGSLPIAHFGTGFQLRDGSLIAGDKAFGQSICIMKK